MIALMDGPRRWVAWMLGASLVVVALSPPAAGQVYVDDFPGTDDAKVRAAVKAASPHSQQNKNATIYFAERVYRFNAPLEFSEHISVASVGRGRRATRWTFHGIKNGTILCHLRQGHGIVFSGIEIRYTGKASGITGLKLESLSSATISDFEVALFSDHSIGIEHTRSGRWGESNVIQRFNCRAANPILIRAGDNLSIRDFDLNCKGPAAVSACIIGTAAPDHWHIGPGAAGGGDHCLFINQSVTREGSGLFLNGIRYEQTTSPAAAWLIRFSINKPPFSGLEVLSISNCRNSRGQIPLSVSGVRKVDLNSNGFHF